jgi:hypothetical protein
MNPMAASLLPRLGRAWNAIKPVGVKGWAGEVAPNLLFAGLGATQLPEGTPAELRAGAFAEELLTSIPLGLLGRAGGYGAARGFAGVRGRPLSPENMGMVQGLAGMGLETTAWGTGLVPRPFATQAWGLADQQVQDEMGRRQLSEREEMRNQLIEELTQQMGGFGAAVGAFQPMPGLPAPGMGVFG